MVHGIDRGEEEYFCLFSGHVGSILQCMRHYFVCSSDQPFTIYNFSFSVAVVLNYFERFNPLDKWKTKNLDSRVQSAWQKYSDKGT